MAYTINSAKEAGVTRKPVHLFDFTWPDGSTLSVCSHALSKDAVDYLARVMDQQIDPIQALSPTGIEIPPSVRLTLADADKSMHMIEVARGFRGARLRVTFAYYDFEASEWSTDSVVPFLGRCDEPEVTDDALIVSAGYVLNLEAKKLPAFPVQVRCPKLFPFSTAQKALADVVGSPYYACGVSDPTKTFCTFDQAGCDANANTLRFGGQTWEVPPASKSREYTSGNWLTDLVSDPNGAKYGDYVPIGYGTAWVDAILLGSWPDANSTRGEAIVCEGRPEAILKVVVQDESLSPANDLDYNLYHVQDPLLRYDVVSNGERTGRRNLDVPWNGAGNSHGSQCVIEWVVYHKLTATLPQVKALVTFPKVQAYAKIASIAAGVVTLPAGVVNEDIAGNSPYTIAIFGNSNSALNGTFGLDSWTGGPPGTVTLHGTTASGTGGYIAYQASSDRYAWAILDVLMRAGLGIADVDLDAFIAANRSHRAMVAFTARDGSSGSHPKYVCGLVIRQQRTAADIATGMLRGCNSHLGRNPATGLIGLYARGSLGAQQATLPDGSNYATLTDGGYYAYHFDETSMVDDKTRLVRKGRAAGSVPNIVTIGFANAENDYSGDSVSVPDADEIERMGQEIPGSIQVDGCNALDRANRVGSIFLAEQIDGPTWRFLTTAKAVMLRVGHIVALSNVKHDFDHDPFRVLQIAPKANWETCEMLVTEHNDAWYADDFTNIFGSPSQGSRRDKLRRPSWAWAPYQVQPATGDPLYGRTDWTFGMQLGYDTSRSGEPEPVITITGKKPVNDPANLLPPVLAAQGTTANTGGTVAGSGRVYWIAAASRDADGRPGPVSKPCQCVVAQTGDTNTITAAVSFWDPAGSGYFVFVGRASNRLMAVNDAGFSGTPSSLTLTSIPEATWGAPDGEFDKLIARPSICEHEGVFGAVLSGVGTRTLTIAGAGWTTNWWAGYDCTIIAKDDLSAVAELNFRVASNTADTLTIASTSPDPAAEGVVAMDVLVMMSLPTVSGLRLTDARWLNTLSNSGLGLAPGEEVGRILRFVKGPGRGYRYLIVANGTDWVEVQGPWVVTPDSTSRYIIEDAAVLGDQVVSQALANSDPQAEISLDLPVRNYTRASLTIEMVTVDGGGAESAANWNPVRMIYVPGAGGTTELATDATMRITDGTVVYNTSGATGGSTTLAAAITDTGSQGVTLASGAGLMDGQCFQVGSEIFRVLSGGGTTTPVCERGAKGSTRATHASGATASYGGVRTYTCLPAAVMPNRVVIVRKKSTDLNGVKIVRGGTDVWPGGGTEIYLWDESEGGGTALIKFPGL
jgi:Putative phage tail protein